MSRLNPKNFFNCFQDKSMDLLNSLQDLYDSEINFSITTFWDGGFTVKLGDGMNGFDATSYFRTFNDCIYWLADAAIKHYPKSTFAKKYNDNFIEAMKKEAVHDEIAGRKRMDEQDQQKAMKEEL